MNIETLKNPTSTTKFEVLPENLRDLVLRIQNLRQNWSNEIPTEEIHGSVDENDQPREKKFKVQKNYFSNITLLISTLLDLTNPDLLSTEFKQNFKAFNDYVTSDEFKKTQDGRRKMTTKEDIDMADKIVDQLLEELKNQVPVA